MILIVSNEGDITTDYVVLELRRRKIPFFRLNSERLPEATVRCHWQYGRPNWAIAYPDRTLLTTEVSAGYFRRPGAPAPQPRISDEAERSYCASEWAAVLRSLYVALEDRWLSTPANIARAEDKALQLALANKIGLKVPPAVITNDHDEAMAFVSSRSSPKIVKAFHTGFFDDPSGDAGRVVFTTRLEDTRHVTRESVGAAPIILQQEIIKRCDVRATVVGERLLAASIDSQVRAETATDWRRGSFPDLPHSRHELPNRIAARCVLLVKSLGLRFAAIDLVLDQTGEYWFLEANPNGQWAWIESRTGLPISSAIVDELVAISVDNGNRNR